MKRQLRRLGEVDLPPGRARRGRQAAEEEAPEARREVRRARRGDHRARRAARGAADDELGDIPDLGRRRSTTSAEPDGQCSRGRGRPARHPLSSRTASVAGSAASSASWGGRRDGAPSSDPCCAGLAAALTAVIVCRARVRDQRATGLEIIGNFEQVGDLVENANVQSSDVKIGTIQKIELDGWEAQVTMCLEPRREDPRGLACSRPNDLAAG